MKKPNNEFPDNTQPPALRPLTSSPGPWRFTLNTTTKSLSLESKGQGSLTVFDCKRWGMGSARLRFRSAENLMVNAEDFGAVIEGREHHKTWALQVDHPDARLIEAAPLLRKLMEQMVTLLKEAANNGEELPQESIDAYIDRFDQWHLSADILLQSIDENQ